MNPVLNLPPQPSNTTDVGYQTAWNTWIVDHARPAMDAYFQRFSARFRELGFAVNVTGSSNETPYFLVVPYWQGTIEKSGIFANWTLTLGQAESREPEAMADHYGEWVWGQEARAASNAGGPIVWTPSEPLNVPLPPVVPNPGPATTVGTGGASSQGDQRPPDTDSGTVAPPPAPPPAAPDRYTFFGWNALNEQQTGRVGPPPDAVGIADPAALITFEEWRAATASWFNTGGAGGNSGGGTGGSGNGGGTGGGSSPATDNTGLYIAGAGALAVLLLAMRRG